MRTVISAIALVAAFAIPVAAQQQQEQPQPQPDTAAQAAHYSVQTTKVSVLLDDPRANAILQRLIPLVHANEMFQTLGRDQTLAAIQQYEPATLTDEMLATIQIEFDKLAAQGSPQG